jgi:death-on-curing protein
VTPPVWIRRETVLALHEQLLAEFGGAAGVRDASLLDSALARPKNLLAYGKPSLCDLAASYGVGLIKNHPFVDGNKRTGFAIAVLFLELNGREFRASEADATVQTFAVAAGATSEHEFSKWLAENSRR